MLRYLVPETMKGISELDKIYELQEEGINNIEESINILSKQSYVLSATSYGLDLWEQFVGLKTDKSRKEQHRRESIIAKLRGQGTTTVSLIKNVAESFTNGEVEVIENTSEYNFTIKFVSILGIPPNIEDLKIAIDEIIPAHLGYTFQFKYNVWNDMLPHTWDNVATNTWDNVKIK